MVGRECELRAVRWSVWALSPFFVALACGGKTTNDSRDAFGGSGGARDGTSDLDPNAAGAATRGGAPSTGGSPSDSGGGAIDEGSGGDSSMPEAGAASLESPRWVLLEPPPPPLTPDGLLPSDERVFATGICCASADAQTLVGVSSYVFPRLVGSPSAEYARGFIWHEHTGVKPLGEISDPEGRTVVAIEPNFLSKDGTRILGTYSVAEMVVGGNDPTWSTHGAGLWTEAHGYTPIDTPAQLSDVYLLQAADDASAAVGGVQTDPDGISNFFWRKSRGFVAIAALPKWPDDGAFTTMSDDGSTLVGFAPGTAGPFRWRDTGVQWLGVLSGTSDCDAQLVSRDGEVIAGTCRNDGKPVHSYRWTEATGMVALDDSASFQFEPMIMNAAGNLLLGGASHAGTGTAGVGFWTPTGGLALDPRIDTQEPPPAYYVNPRTLSADSKSALGELLLIDKTSRAFQWTASGGLLELPALPGHQSSHVEGQSSSGRFVAGAMTDPPGALVTATLWDQRAPRDIGAELESAGVDLHGYHPIEAVGVADARPLIVYGHASPEMPRSDYSDRRAWVAWLPARD